MKSIFNPDDNNEIIQRINKLGPGATPIWGKMNAAQMLAHCQQPIKVALGESKGTHSFIGKLFGGIARRQLMGEKPMKKNLPTDKTFLVKEERNFDQEKDKLIALIKKFQAGPSILMKGPHPFFGKMNVQEWDTITWKHLDHHLQQFGV